MSTDAKPSTVRELYVQAARIKEDAARRAYLDEACGSQIELRQRVEQLLTARGVERDNVLQLATSDSMSGRSPLSWDGDDGSKTIDSHPETMGDNRTRDDAIRERIDVSTHPMIGRYKVLEELGHGGMGTVYMAQQTEPVRRKVALKVIKPGMDSDEVIARFEAERQSLAMMDHPNVAKVLDGGTTESGRPFFVMELVHGVPVTQFCDENRLSNRERLTLFIDICRAVQHAHMKGIIHRDLKPSNVLVTMNDDKPMPKVIDFGVSKALSQQLTDKTMFTAYGQMVGTPLYMSPEQAQFSSQDIDVRSDVYSLGVLLYELLTGDTPFDRATLNQSGFDEMRRIIREVDPPRPSYRVSTLKAEQITTTAHKRQTDTRKLGKSLQGELDWIVMKALEKDRSRRYESAGAFAADVKRYLDDEPVEACPPSITYRMKKYATKHKGLATTACLLTAVVLFATGLLFNERGLTLAALAGEKEQRQAAEKQREDAEAQEEAALRSASEALRQRDNALRNQYVAEIVSGQSDLERGYLQRLNTKLTGHLPLTDQPDRRGWEWFWLWSQCHPEVRTLHASTSQTYANWSPDGEFIGSSGDVWRAATGEAMQRISPSRISRGRADWSPDGRMFAWGMASDDCGIYLWDGDTDELRQLRGHESSVWCLDFSPDGTLLASSGIDQTVRIWNVSTGQTLRSFPLPYSCNDIAWSPDGALLATGIIGQGVFVLDSATGNVVAQPSLPHRSRSEVQISWHPSCESLAICAPSVWYLVRRNDWTVSRQQDLEVRRGRDISWSPDGETLALVDGEVVSLWDPTEDKPVRILQGHASPILNVSWSPDGNGLVTSDRGGEVKIWDVQSSDSPPQFEVGETIQTLDWLSDNETLVVKQKDATSSFWNALDGQRLKIEPPISTGEQLWSPDRRLVAAFERTWADVPEVRVLDAADDTVHAIWHGDTRARILKVGWSKDRTMLAIATQPRVGERVEIEVVIWNVDNEQAVSEWSYVGPLNGSIYDKLQIIWGPAGNRLAVNALGTIGDDGLPLWQGHVYVVDVEQGVTVLKHNVGGWSHGSDVKALAWQPDGSAVAAGTKDGMIEAVEVDSGRTVFSTRLHSTAINSLSWSPDGLRIVSAAQDGSVKLLTADAGKDLLTFKFDDSVTDVAWSPSGNRLASATASGHVHVWDAARAKELSEYGSRRGEMAMAYYRKRADESPAEEQSRRRTFLRLAPDTPDFWPRRGNVRASLGEFEHAVDEYAKAIRPGLSRSFEDARWYGYSLLAAGKIESYQRHCQSLLDTFAETDVPSNGANVVWLCSLTTNDDISMETILRLAEQNAKVNVGDGGDTMMLVLGAAYYRSGQYDKAAEALTDVAAKLKQSGSVSAFGDLTSTLYFLAMARHQLGHAFQARRHMNEAANVASEAELAGDPAWHQKLTLKLLSREAESLITPGQALHNDQRLAPDRKDNSDNRQPAR